jgi:hypothetical protein
MFDTNNVCLDFSGIKLETAEFIILFKSELFYLCHFHSRIYVYLLTVK